MNLSFYFSSSLIRSILSGVILLNIFFLFGTWLHNSLLLTNTWYVIPRLVAILNLAAENNAAAWYSSMLLFVVAIAALFCFINDFQNLKRFQDRILSLGWIILTMIFIVLSFDEMGSFHEIIGETALFKKMGSSHGAGWYAFYALIAMVVIFMMLFSFLKFKNNKKAFFFAALGATLFVSNPFQEIYEIHSWENSADPDNWRRPIFFMILEEGSEIFASFCFLKAFILYALNPKGEHALDIANKGFRIEIIIKNLFVYFLTFAVLVGLLMVVVKFNAWQMEGDDGIAHNWFPSSMSFLVALMSSYLYFLSRDKMPSYKITLLLFTFFSLFMSFFYGSNMYAAWEMPLNKIPFIFLLTTVILGGLALFKLQSRIAKLGLTAGIACAIISYYTKDFKTAMFGYLAASLFLIALLSYYQYLAAGLKKNSIINSH